MRSPTISGIARTSVSLLSSGARSSTSFLPSSAHQSHCISLQSARSLHCQTSSRPRAVVPVFMSIVPGGPPTGYRPNVGLCLINDYGQVFLARRVDLPDSWQMPQGGVDENEEPQSAALRELQEETGVTSAEMIGEVAEWITYDFPPDVKSKITQLWGREWTGQAQKWFLFKFSGDESEINLDADGIERAEFSEWKWASPDEVVEKAVEFKKSVYQKVFKAFAPFFGSTSDGGIIAAQADVQRAS